MSVNSSQFRSSFITLPFAVIIIISSVSILSLSLFLSLSLPPSHAHTRTHSENVESRIRRRREEHSSYLKADNSIKLLEVFSLILIARKQSLFSNLGKESKFLFVQIAIKMNDLMTNSFLSYVDLKKQAQIDVEQESDLEMGEQIIHKDDENLSHFFQQAEEIKNEMQEITDLLLDLQSLNEETKSTYSAKILRGLRDRMDSDMVAVLRKTKIVKGSLDALDKSNEANRKVSVAYAEGSAVDRTRVSTTNGLRVKLKDLMNGFQALREKIMEDYKDGLRRRYYNSTGVHPSEKVIEEMVSGNGKIQVFDEKSEKNLENRERHEAVMDIWRSLNKLHQLFLDMAVMVEAQGQQIDDIEHNVTTAASFVSGGTNSLFYAQQMKKESRKWVCWVWAVGFIIVLVCLVAMLTN